jgi:hypothetical protein
MLYPYGTCHPVTLPEVQLASEHVTHAHNSQYVEQQKGLRSFNSAADQIMSFNDATDRKRKPVRTLPSYTPREAMFTARLSV